MKKRVSDLKIGDLVDLEGDRYADPNRDHISFGFEYQEVATIEHETPDCIAVGFEGFDVVGFPPWHMVKVGSRADEETSG